MLNKITENLHPSLLMVANVRLVIEVFGVKSQSFINNDSVILF
jgi:hypothetical protein